MRTGEQHLSSPQPGCAPCVCGSKRRYALSQEGRPAGSTLSVKIQIAGLILYNLADDYLFRTRKTSCEASSVLVPLFRFWACIWGYHLNMARHLGSSHSCNNIERVSTSSSFALTNWRCTHMVEFDRRRSMLGWYPHSIYANTSLWFCCALDGEKQSSSG